MFNFNVRRQTGLMIGLCSLFIFSSAQAEDVIVTPAYISGSLTLDGYPTELTQIFADSVSGTSSLNVYTNNYEMTVSAPATGSKDYTLRVRFFSNQNRDVMYTEKRVVSVSAGQATTENYNITPAILQDTISAVGFEINYGWLYVNRPQWGQESSARGYVDGQGNFSFPNINSGEVTVIGEIYSKTGELYRIEPQTVVLTPGQTSTMNYIYDATVANPGSVSGNIVYNAGNSNIDVSVYRHYLYLTNNTTADRKDLILSNDESLYQFTGLQPGLWNFNPRLISYLNNMDDYFRPPYNSYNYQVTIEPNSSLVNDINVDLAFINGRVRLMDGATDLTDKTTGSIYYFGDNWSGGTAPTYGGYSVDSFGNNGLYDSVVTSGDWLPYVSLFRVRDIDDTKYIRTDLNVYDYSRTEFMTLEAGEVVNNHNIDIPVGRVTINLSVEGGDTFINPYVNATCYNSPERTTKPYRYASGSAYGRPNIEATTGQVTFVGPTLPCTFYAYGRINGSNVLFGKFDLEILSGTDVVVDVGGPSLTIAQPAPESYINGATLTVTGTVSDDIGVDAVTVNDVVATLTSTNNQNDVNEMQFSATIKVVGGPNSIKTIATDTSGKLSSDTRTVYNDASAPTMSWTPSDASIISESSVVVQGTATDDNVITSVTVNGTAVAFSSTNNASDINEVSFSTSISLVEGANLIVVSTSDNSLRTTTETRTITKVNNRPPIANAGSDQTVECLGSLTQVSLNGSASSDPDGDTLSYLWQSTSALISGVSPTVDLALGNHVFSLTVDDQKGFTTSDSVDINITDTISPVITISDLNPTLEVTSIDGASYQVVHDATDSCDKAMNVVALPEAVYPLGSTLVTVDAVDASNNSSSASTTISVVDTTAPVFTHVPADINVIASGISTLVDIGMATASDIFPVTMDYSPKGPFGLGETTVTWTASDANGRAQTATQKVRVSYNFGGFLAPLKAGGIYKLGRVIPVKFQLYYADGFLVTNANATLSVVKTSNNEVVGDPLTFESTSAADNGETFRFSDDQYIYNLDTSYFEKGTFRILVDLGDGSVAKSIDIAFK